MELLVWVCTRVRVPVFSWDYTRRSSGQFEMLFLSCPASCFWDKALTAGKISNKRVMSLSPCRQVVSTLHQDYFSFALLYFVAIFLYFFFWFFLFLCGFWALNVGPHVYTTTTLLTELSLQQILKQQPQYTSIKFKLIYSPKQHLLGILFHFVYLLK